MKIIMGGVEAKILSVAGILTALGVIWKFGIAVVRWAVSAVSRPTPGDIVPFMTVAGGGIVLAVTLIVLSYKVEGRKSYKRANKDRKDSEEEAHGHKSDKEEKVLQLQDYKIDHRVSQKRYRG